MKSDDADATFLNRNKQVGQGTCKTTFDSNGQKSTKSQHKVLERSFDFSLLNQHHWRRAPRDSDSEPSSTIRERNAGAKQILSNARSSLLLKNELDICEKKLILEGKPIGATIMDGKNGQDSSKSQRQHKEKYVGQPQSIKRMKYAQGLSPLSGTSDNTEDRLRKKYENELYALRLLHGPDDSRLCDAICRLGLFYQHISRDLDQALFYHKDALRIMRAESTECSSNSILKATGIILVDIGRIYESKANYKVAKENYR